MAWTRTAYRRKPKFSIGTPLTEPTQVLSAVLAGRWLYFGKPPHVRAYHATWIVNMNFSCVMSYIHNGRLHFAHRNDEYPYVFKATWFGREPWDVDAKQGEWCATCSEVPHARIVELTKDTVAREAEKAVIECTGKRIVRVQIRFQLPETTNAPVALLRP